ncbi:MAG: MSEP-CTERM sorting domain-containing protein, partial [Lewinella sp.]
MNLLNPRWLWPVAVLPFLLLFTLSFHQYTLIESLLEDVNHRAWVMHGTVLILMLGSGFLAAVVQDARGGSTGLSVIIALLLSVILYGFWTLADLSMLVPGSVPRWLREDYLPLYILSCLMPAGVYAVFGFIHLTTRQDREYHAWSNFAVAILMPLGCYLFGTVLFSVINPFASTVFTHVCIMAILAITVAFLFFLLRGVYLMVRDRKPVGRIARLALLILTTLVFPVLGLWVNNSSCFSTGLFGRGGVFGEFGHPVFYLLAIANGLYNCLPRTGGPAYRLVLFLVGCAGLPFLGYFALIFLPFLPLSIVAILLVGTGFLMLTPLVMLPIQVIRLRHDYASLRNSVRPRLLQVGGSLLFLLLPAAITVTYLGDRDELARALDYVYAPAAMEGQVDRKALARVVDNLRLHKGGGTSFGRGTPYLSDYYAWLVLDNLTLSETKLQTLEGVFLGRTFRERDRPRRWETSPVELRSATVRSEYVDTGGYYASWVDLDMQSDSSSIQPGEYRVTFDLPPGCYVDDYYLYVGDRRERGQLTERRTATWVYNQIVGTRQDPGLLRYVAADRLELSVFPFTAGEHRRTGFRILHPEPIDFIVDGHSLRLGNGYGPAATKVTRFPGGAYIPASLKDQLPHVRRLPKFQIVVDASRRYQDEEDLIDRVERFVDGLPPE